MKLRRAKSLLGTLVEVSLEGVDEDLAIAASEAAFMTVARVHALMSFHEPGSDLSRINRAQPGQAIEVDPMTAQVLLMAQRVWRASGGLFDCALGASLVRMGVLPSVDAGGCAGPHDADQMGTEGERVAAGEPFEVSGLQVARRSGCWLDLGGIAKGYAVDCAVEVIMRVLGRQQAQPRRVVVDAGGDVRHAGTEPVRIGLRDPVSPGRICATVELCNAALASSSGSARQNGTRPAQPGWLTAQAASMGWVGLTQWQGSTEPATSNELPRSGSVLDPRSRQELPLGACASVTAPTCMLADALTKVVLVGGRADPPCLAAFGARTVFAQQA